MLESWCETLQDFLVECQQMNKALTLTLTDVQDTASLILSMLTDVRDTARRMLNMLTDVFVQNAGQALPPRLARKTLVDVDAVEDLPMRQTHREGHRVQVGQAMWLGRS